MTENKLDYRELMIGNYVKINNPKHRPNDNGRLAITLEVRQDSVSLQLINDEYGINSFGQLLEFIEGVPLTEEILIKCGYEIISVIENNKTYEILVEEVDIDYGGNDYFELKVIESVTGNKEIMIQHNYYDRVKIIKYIHELQNLYFILTKQNLEIRL